MLRRVTPENCMREEIGWKPVVTVSLFLYYSSKNHKDFYDFSELLLMSSK